MQRPALFPNGLLVLNKPSGITSRSAINALQRLMPRNLRIGHTGTLDPLASGVLVVCLGSATKLTEEVQAFPKCYTARIRLGATSDTDDADGLITPSADSRPVPRDEIAARLSSFVGIVDQVPPRISAVKIQGRRAHALERKGADFELLPRPVIIETIEILDYDWPTLTLRIRCGKGTYIRSIARDLGERLGVGGYIETLHRDYVGVFRTEDAIPYPKIADWRDYWLPMTRAVEHYPQYLLSDDQADRIRYGQRIPIEAPVGRIAARRDDDLVALGSVEDGEFRPTTVFSAHG